MWEYLLKSGACMAVLLLFYKLLLEKENMHVFKRFYLLGALIISFIIPNLVFVEYVIPAAVPIVEVPLSHDTTPITVSERPTDIDIINWSLILWGVYVLGLVGFGIRFLRHLFQIIYRIKTNPKHKEKYSIKVLLQESLPPHTFFNYVFLNQQKFKTNTIPQEVLLHEETHARQRHSLDVLFIEALQIFLWFNPFIYFFKRSIKLNHEFLADSAVLAKEKNTVNYQNTLLSYISQDSFNKYQSAGISNAINYSSIKKRFTVMKKRTSKKGIALRVFLLLPLLALLIYGFSEIKTVEKKVNNTMTPAESVNKSIDFIEIHIDENQNISISNNRIPIHLLSERITHMITLNNEGAATQDIYIESEGTLDINLLGSIKGEIEKAGAFIKKITADTIKIINEEKWEDDYKGTILIARDSLYIRTKDNDEITGISTKKSQSEIENNLVININKNGQLLVQDELVSLKILPLFISRYVSNLPEYQRRKIKTNLTYDTRCPKEILDEVKNILRGNNIVKPNVKKTNTPIPENNQKKATSEDIIKYNILAKKYNSMLAKKGNIQIKKSEVDRLEYLYNLMSKKQKAKAESFPDFPEPPEPPMPPKAPIEIEEENIVQEIIENQEIIAVEGKGTRFLAPTKVTTANNQNSGWKVISGANRDSRKYNNESLPENINDIPLPPAAPTIALHANRDGYSKTLETSIQNYLNKNTSYEKAFLEYTENKKGKSQNLWGLYNEAMKSYVAYHVIANEEGKFIQPIPAYKNREANKRDISTPPAPPEPISPLDHAIEMAKQGATFYYKGKKITSDKAIEILKENEDLSMDISRTNGQKPVVKISKYF